MKQWITYELSPHGSPVSYPVPPWGSLGTREMARSPTAAEARLLSESLNLAPNAPVPGKGYPTFHVLIDGFEWQFASLAEIDLAMRTLSTRHLPNVRSMAWWVNRLPSGTTDWRKRRRITRALSRAVEAFELELKRS